ncbi:MULTISPECIES: BNR repeat-containing protein [Sphingobacterium]|uniref:BNR-4 repeat-containing protein n=1 Tax=Sphingobacterium litopenaei TaxID=2763500 RepID=A0ABR7YBF5_9SPHI|nr:MULTISPECIES: BNR repeat-containing protein [Sphingobacterium]MBD1428639.1 BNR-4 repeat-containing protein [Sphingobacterium litopenaei]NGM73320.1 neuraminidase [Sphingobacterium sp. SGL-16]
MPKKFIVTFIVLFVHSFLFAQKNIQISEVGQGWAKNTVNTAVFRKNSLVSNQNFQYIAYYDDKGFLIVGQRKLNSSTWTLKNTGLKGNAKDAHNVISIMLDGANYLHVAFDHHNSKLRYIRSLEPNSLEFSAEIPMVGTQEKYVSYPEFFKLTNGNLLFMYRDGGSGNGNLMINRYIFSEKKWLRLQDKLIDGEGKRNAYWQSYIDDKGRIHISWVWRESPDVASNHDMAYAYSDDEGITWKKTTGELYHLPITAKDAEYAIRIPEKSDLINQTAMSADENGNPFIVSYWRDQHADKPQYKIIYLNKGKWLTHSFDFRKTTFSLGGHGTKQIPISRPQLLVKGKAHKTKIWMIFRDEERNNAISVLSWTKNKPSRILIEDIYNNSVAAWEPTYDTELWRSQKRLSLFVQHTVQVDGEGLAESDSTPVRVLDLKP